MVDINSTFINWINYVLSESAINMDEIRFIRTTWNQLIPNDIHQLGNDICMIIKDLSIIDINMDLFYIIFQHTNDKFILLYVKEYDINTSDVYIYTGNTKDELIEFV